MTKKLLQQTSRVYLVFSVLVLAMAAPIFYFLIQGLYMEDVDNALKLFKKEFVTYSSSKLSIADIPNWNKFNRDIKIQPSKDLKRDTIFFTTYYDALDDEIEPYKELNAPIRIEGKAFTFTAKINLIETEDLIQNIALLFCVVIFMFLVGLFFINKVLSQQLWKPFNHILTQIENFEIDKNKPLHFTKTHIEEFNRLRHSIEKLIVKNISIYKNQREFVENAAHELQTPLAIFQAKVDSLMQVPDITQEQSVILDSLNEGVARLNRLNKNLLLLSKIENDSYNEKQVIILNESIQKNLDFFNEQAKEKNIAIQLQLNERVQIQSNTMLLEILINNLFLNAIKHNITDGIIEVELYKRTFNISNTGQAYPLIAEKLFQRFSKSSSSTQGNGLGLAIVKKIAELNQWQITYTFENNLHCFTVRF